MDVTLDNETIHLDTELEPGYEEFDFIRVIDNYEMDDTIKVDINNIDDKKGEEDEK